MEAVLRQSHAEQFEWLENKFGLPLRKGLQSFPTFIELTERRNLFVHTSGVVSTQYISVCRKHSVPLASDLAVGKERKVTPEYFASAHDCLFEIGVKLAHVLWRKTLPSDRDRADANLIAVSYDLLSEAKHRLAAELLDFATEVLKTHASERNRRLFIINRAQAYKWMGNQKKALEIVGQEDWSAASDDFKLAELVLRNDFDAAAKLMKRIGSGGAIRKADYGEWPLFQEFRKTDVFRAAFHEMFGEGFSVLEPEESDAGEAAE